MVGRKKKPVTAVDDVSIRIARGEIYGILGANGGGKSTLIRLVSTLLTLDTGRVEVFGHDIERDEMAVKRLINRVSWTRRSSRSCRPYENLIYAARLYGLDPAGRRARGDRHPGPAGHRREAARPAARADEPGHAAEGGHRQGPPDEPDAAAPRRADDRPRPAHPSWTSRPSSRSCGTTTTPRSCSPRTTSPRPTGSATGSRSSTDGRLVVEGTPDELKARVATSTACRRRSRASS